MTKAQPAAAAEKSLDVKALVQIFFDHTPHWSMTMTGTGVVVYNTDALSTQPSELKSVSFDFADGSTMSLVGLPADLPHLAIS